MSGHWTVVNASNGGPEARYEHVAAWDADLAAGRRLLWVHGGWDGQKALRDLWKFDAGTHAWTLVSNGDSGPSERWAHVCAWDAQTQQLWVHGGVLAAADRPNFWFHGGRAALITPDVPLAELWQFSQLEVECRLGGGTGPDPKSSGCWLLLAGTWMNLRSLVFRKTPTDPGDWGSVSMGA
eukprot:Skav202576  [mRNA]  locus=scaffold104:182951:189796:- [translate_table: standard]